MRRECCTCVSVCVCVCVRMQDSQTFPHGCVLCVLVSLSMLSHPCGDGQRSVACEANEETSLQDAPEHRTFANCERESLGLRIGDFGIRKDVELGTLESWHVRVWDIA